jgi:hypothetical protein
LPKRKEAANRGGLLANVKPGAHVAAPGFIVESSLEDSKVLVVAIRGAGFFSPALNPTPEAKRR